MGNLSYNMDFTTAALTWSEELYSVYGFDRSVASNTMEWWTERIHPDDAIMMNEAMDKLNDPFVRDWTIQYRFRKADNSYILVQDQATVVRDAVGKPVRLRGTLTPMSPEAAGVQVK